MPLGRKARLTKERLNRERNRMRRGFPAWYKEEGVITSLESCVANYENAVIEAVSGNEEINPDPVRLLVFLYQFEFFEKQFVYIHYRKHFQHNTVFSDRHASMKLTELIEYGYVELFERRNYKYSEEEDRITYIRVEEKKSYDTYCISDKGLQIIKEFYTLLTHKAPSRVTKNKRILIWESQTKEHFDNINGGWDLIK